MGSARLPLRVNVNVTRRCNLRCWYCHSSSGPEYRGPELSETGWRRVLEGAEALGVFEVTLTGGEPFMWSNFPAAMRASRELEWTSLEILTNALVLTPRRVAALRAGNVARVCVSLDGVADAHEVNRGQGSYAKTLEGIARVREVVDNVTVISVVDRTNAERWPELTERLIGLGVRQHHLSPVCFAGHAMEDYQGLSAEQFAAVRERVDAHASGLPAGFTLRFNDGLLRLPTGRRLSISTLVEVEKGLHLQVMPDGALRAAVRVWGRSWRANETLGNVNDTGLAELVEQTAPRRAGMTDARFPLEDEVRRKFHIGADEALIEADVEAVRSSERGGRVHLNVSDGGSHPSLFDDPCRLSADADGLRACAEQVRREPTTARLRVDADVAFLFDTNSFDVTLLTPGEAREVGDLGPVPTRRAA